MAGANQQGNTNQKIANDRKNNNGKTKMKNKSKT